MHSFFFSCLSGRPAGRSVFARALARLVGSGRHSSETAAHTQPGTGTATGLLSRLLLHEHRQRAVRVAEREKGSNRLRRDARTDERAEKLQQWLAMPTTDPPDPERGIANVA